MWIRVADAALLVCKPEPTIYRWIREGRLPSRRIGFRVVVDGRAVLELEATLRPPSRDPVTGRFTNTL